MLNQDDLPRLKNSQETAEITGISRRTLQRFAKTGRITTYYSGRKLLFFPDEVVKEIRRPKAL